MAEKIKRGEIEMAKMVKCKTCGAEIAKTAKTCPHCGAKQHTVALSICAVLVVLMIFSCIGIIATSGSGEEPSQVGSIGDTPSSNSQGTSQSSGQSSVTDVPDVFQVGDIVSLNDVNVTLLSVTESARQQFLAPRDGNVFVLFEFDIDNQSDSEIAISSMLSFEAYFDDYAASISISAMSASGQNQLDGSVAGGKKMTGVVGYEAPADWSEAEVRFTPNFWNGQEIVFEYAK